MGWLRPWCGAVVLVICSSFAFAENWDRFRGPNGTGVSSDKNVPISFNGKDKTNIAWKAVLPGVGNSSPVVWENQVLIHASSADGKKRMLISFDAKTGEQQWVREFGPSNTAHIHKKNSWASATPAVDADGVYVPFWNGKSVHLHAYSLQGKPLWQRELGHFVSQHGPAASPIIHKDKIFIAHDMDKDDPVKKLPVADPSTLFAIDKKSGEIAWKLPRTAYRACYSAPFLLGSPNPELIVTSTTAITAYDPDSGKKNWEHKGEFNNKKGNMPLRTISSTLHVDGMLLSGSGDGAGDRHLVALALSGDSSPPRKIWENRKDFPYVPCLLSRSDHVFFVNDGGFAGCYEIKTGKQVWYERQHEAQFTGSPVMIDGKIYAPSEEGDVFVFEASAKFNLLARNPLGETIRTSPAVANNRLFVRGEKHLFCIAKTN